MSVIRLEDEEISLFGHVKVYSGIPRHSYNEDQYNLFPEECLKQEVVLLSETDNMVVNMGKTELLKGVFRPPFRSGDIINPFVVGWMAIGDGGYDFASESRLRVTRLDTDLGNKVDMKSIGNSSYSFPLTQNQTSGSVEISTTFYSEDAGTKEGFSFLSANPSKFINEAGLFTKYGDDYKLFARITLPDNLSFEPRAGFAITFNWLVVFR